MTSVYISGPMEGVQNYEENFRRAECKLIIDGYAVVNPAVVGCKGRTVDAGHLAPEEMRCNLYA